MRAKYIWIMLATFLFLSCDDSLGELGVGVLPGEDDIPTRAASYEVTTQSVRVDSIYARTNMAYLGKYTDIDFGTFEADFLTEFSCPENFEVYYDENRRVPNTTKTYIELTYAKSGGYFGDSLTTARLNIYELDKVIEDDPNVYYYTDIDPTDYYDPSSSPLGQTIYSPKNPLLTDSVYNNSDYLSVILQVDPEKRLGERIIQLNEDYPEYFKNSETFKNNVLKGVYVTSDHGEGAILYIDKIQLVVLSDIYYVDSTSTMTDSILHNYPIALFESSKEVVQANRFQNSEALDQWVEDTHHSYLKTPAGIFTEVTLPIDNDEFINSTDSLNLASITFTNYNEVSNNGKKYEMPPPGELLMIRKKDMMDFFSTNQLPDNITSYVVKHEVGVNANITYSNTYNFTNIARLISTALSERRSGNYDEDWNKVMLIPVTTTQTANAQNTTVTIAVRHELKLTSAKLVGGLEGERIKMDAIWSTLSLNN